MNLPLPPVFKSDRWGNSWSKEGVLLKFGNSSLATAVRIDAQSAAKLAAQLKAELARYEALHGTLWSEDALVNGAKADASLALEEQRPFTSEGLSVYRLVKTLPLDGLEQSFKLRQGELLGGRFLAGISRSKFSDEDFQHLAEQMGAPEELRNAIRQQLGESIFIHIGFEQGKTGSTCKVYLEFPLAQDKNPEGFHPLYKGFKWSSQLPLQHAISTYSQPHPMEQAALLASMASTFAELDCAAYRAACRIIQLAMASAPGNPLALVQVTDNDSPRTSFDVNLYETGLTLEALAPALETLATALGVTENYEEVRRRTRDHLAGHMSGGTDRDGRPFLTIYHARQRPVKGTG